MRVPTTTDAANARSVTLSVLQRLWSSTGQSAAKAWATSDGAGTR